MIRLKNDLYPTLTKTVEKIDFGTITTERKTILGELIKYIKDKVRGGSTVHLNFICTHNSRRSQLAQIWAQTAADYFDVPTRCYSGGVEVTAFNERAVASIKRMGFIVNASGDANLVYDISHSANTNTIRCFSKVFDDEENSATHFAAVMTCDHADENCPFIPGTEKRIPIRYDDPKAFDDTLQETEKYDERSIQIATEMFYVFSNIRN